MSALFLEVVIDGGAVHADGLSDLGDGVLPLSVRTMTKSTTMTGPPTNRFDRVREASTASIGRHAKSAVSWSLNRAAEAIQLRTDRRLDLTGIPPAAT
jgi:hypothetical protein